MDRAPVIGGVGAVLLDYVRRVDAVPVDPLLDPGGKSDGSYDAVRVRVQGSVDRRVGGPVFIGDAYAKALGAQALLVGAIGRDDDGQIVRSFMGSQGLSQERIQERSGGTAITLLLIEPGGRRTLLVAQGPDAVQPPSVEQARRFVDQIDALHIDGREPTAALVLGREAKAQGKRVYYDVGNWKPHSADLFEVATIVQFPKRSAAKCLGLEGDAGLDMNRAAREIGRRYGLPLVVITDGENGFAFSEGGRPGTYVPAYDIGVAADTNGAGDIFAGVSLLELIRGAVPADAFGYASAVAAMACRESGHEKMLAPGGLTDDMVRRFQIEHQADLSAGLLAP